MKVWEKTIAPVCIVLLTSGCDFLSPGRREFLIAVDSATVPTTVSASAPLEVRVFGPVGPDVCYRFKKFHVSRGAAGADISVVGEHDGGTCGQMPVYLDGQLLVLEPPLTDPFSLQFIQPDGSRLTKTIRVQ